MINKLNIGRIWTKEKIIINFIVPIISIFLAIFVGGIIVALLGYNPLATYGALIKGSFGNLASFTVTITKSLPLIFTGLAVAVSFKCGLFNIGGEGQFLMGAIGAVFIGYNFDLPPLLHVPLALAAAMVMGAAWAFIPALLHYKRNVNIVISTIMFSYIGQYVVSYLSLGPLNSNGIPATYKVKGTAMLPRLLPAPNLLHLGAVVAVITVIAVYILITRTVYGYKSTATGKNIEAAKCAGINVAKISFSIMFVSGALAGLGGGVEVLGSLYRVYSGYSPLYGYTAIPVALIARSNPIGLVFVALLFGAMGAGAITMQSMVGVPSALINVLQGLIVIFIGIDYLIRYIIFNFIQRKENG